MLLHYTTSIFNIFHWGRVKWSGGERKIPPSHCIPSRNFWLFSPLLGIYRIPIQYEKRCWIIIWKAGKKKILFKQDFLIDLFLFSEIGGDGAGVERTVENKHSKIQFIIKYQSICHVISSQKIYILWVSAIHDKNTFLNGDTKLFRDVYWYV